MLPFIVAALVILHLSLLHLDESTNEDDEYVEFYYYYFIKDLFAFFLLMVFFAFLVFFNPNYLSHPDNYIMASISVTPAHLVPEWYFLPFYGVLRSTPDKFGGLVLMFGMIVDLFLIDTILDDEENDDLEDIDGSDDSSDDMDSEIEEDDDIGNLLVLFFLGGSDIDEPYTDLAAILTLLQFLDYFEVDLEEGEED
jgi:ubiquinol-cytochrome c reductase cytochrome b subunit